RVDDELLRGDAVARRRRCAGLILRHEALPLTLWRWLARKAGAAQPCSVSPLAMAASQTAACPFAPLGLSTGGRPKQARCAGMSDGFPFLEIIIFAAIAGFLVLRLRSV